MGLRTTVLPVTVDVTNVTLLINPAMEEEEDSSAGLGMYHLHNNKEATTVSTFHLLKLFMDATCFGHNMMPSSGVECLALSG
jgi:hypothetical protein